MNGNERRNNLGSHDSALSDVVAIWNKEVQLYGSDGGERKLKLKIEKKKLSHNK